MATTIAAMILYERGKLDLDSKVSQHLPAFGSSDVRQHRVTLQMLLAHCSGLPAHAKLYQTAKSREQALAAAFGLPLTSDPGTRVEYSDIGFILLGEILGKIAGEPLDSFCSREIFAPLGMSRTAFNPPATWKPLIPPTVEDN
jgi:CubicO group peptidase (beta-lactamase class C family)